MKKIITLIAVLATFACTLYAHEPDSVNPRIIAVFNKTFAGATNVKWETIDTYARATFTVQGQSMYVYFSPDARQHIVTRQLAPDQLPINLSTQLNEIVEGGKIVELFEVLSNGETTYYVSVLNETHSRIYKASASGYWHIFKKEKNKR